MREIKATERGMPDRCAVLVRRLLFPFLAFLLLLLLPVSLRAQRQQQDILTEKQVDDLRDAAQDPEARIKLYVGYIDDRATEIRKLNTDPSANNKAAQLHNLYGQFTQLSDELGDNMDDFDQQHGDMRKVLKLVMDKTTEWTAALNAPKDEEEYDFVRKSALNSCQDVHDDAAQILDEQTKYFAEQKKEAKEQAKEQEKNSETR
jgi:hypothetical protein